MALVVFLRGVNVGGHKTFRPTVLARELERFDVVNVGAAGTFVIRKRVGRRELRAEIMRCLPFDAELMICSSADVLRLTSGDPFADQVAGPTIVHFASVLARRAEHLSSFPVDLPSEGPWTVRILGHQGQFVFGLYRREMRAIRYLDKLDKIVGAPVTTRNWNTMLAVARILRA